MTRIRTIKPGMFRHEELFEAEQDFGLPLRLSFIGLWCCCDREGRFEWAPRKLKLDILPFDDIDFSRVLDALVTREFVIRYTCGTKVYGWIPSFKRHQVINNREAQSELPSFEESIEFQSLETDIQRVSHACPTRHDLAQAEGEREREEERKKEDDEERNEEMFRSSSAVNEKNPSLTADEFDEAPLTQNSGAIDPGDGPYPTAKEPDTRRASAKPIELDWETGQWENISAKQRELWSRAYPALSLDAELAAAAAWIVANPANKKSNYARYITGWLRRSQDKAPRVNGSGPPSAHAGPRGYHGEIDRARVSKVFG